LPQGGSKVLSLRLGVAVNPVAGGGRGIIVGEEVLKLLQATGHRVIDLSAESMISARDRIDNAIYRGAIDALILVGGDGMAHLGANVCAGKNIPMALIPAGTGNDAAAVFGMPISDTGACVELILENLSTHKLIDAIKITHGLKTTWAIGSASAGFDALATARANAISWPKGPMRYYVAMLLELAKFKPIKYQSVIDGNSWDFEAMLCVVSNTGVFGGGMLVVPDASLTDGLLDVLLVKKMSRLKFVAIFPKVYKGTHVTDKDVEILRATNISITASGMPIYSDGEYVGQAPFYAEVVPRALKVIAPAIKGV
jgi:Sphingosine kinase and enzymes related to eukaryotic diacylglycerol kinase